MDELITRTHAIFKFNNGIGALLCSKCHIIIKEGNKLSPKERRAMLGKEYLKPQYCSKCN